MRYVRFFESNVGRLSLRCRYVSFSLSAQLLASSVVLLGTLTIHPGQYRNVQPVVAADQTEDSPSSETTEHLLAVSTSGMEHNGHSNSPFDDKQYSIVQDRVAVNIWARSGYLESAEWH
jgi:hypothetical protein